MGEIGPWCVFDLVPSVRNTHIISFYGSFTQGNKCFRMAKQTGFGRYPFRLLRVVANENLPDFPYLVSVLTENGAGVFEQVVYLFNADHLSSFERGIR